MKIELTINGTQSEYEIHPGTLLLELLRSQGYLSVKQGDEDGWSGCDIVLVNGSCISSGIYLAAQAHGKSILTVEGLGTPEQLHPIQEAFVESGAVQCGYCTPAMILNAYELLSRNPRPTEEEIRECFSGTLCRCTGYVKPVEAVMLAARRMSEGAAK